MTKKNHEVLKQFQAFKQKTLPTVNEVIDGDYALVELFKYEVKDKKEKAGTKKLVLLGADGQYKSAEEVMNNRFLPLAKIISVGKGWTRDHDVGDIVTLPASDIVGADVWNPEFKHLMQFKDSSIDLKIPDDMRKKISSLEDKWYRYRYYDPFDFDSHSKETRMYVIPSSKIVGKWIG